MNKPISWICTICFVFILQSAFAECIATYLVTRRNGVVVDRELLYVTCSDDPSFSGEESGSGSLGDYTCVDNRELGSAHQLPITCRLWGRVSGSEKYGNLDASVFLKSQQLNFDFRRHGSLSYSVSCTSINILGDDSKIYHTEPYGKKNMLVKASFLVRLELDMNASSIFTDITLGMLTLGDRWNRHISSHYFYLDKRCFLIED